MPTEKVVIDDGYENALTYNDVGLQVRKIDYDADRNHVSFYPHVCGEPMRTDLRFWSWNQNG